MHLMPQIVNVSAVEKRDRTYMPGIINIEAMTTLTGEQRQMMDGIVTETRPLHRMHAPGLPAEDRKDGGVPLMKVGGAPATKSVVGMRHISGTKY